ncbi:hypothetical protein NYO98_10455 [Nocardioides sp. STR2]|uniref:DUF3168 domain-containing protein n=1 Tax=Nocardioides pini TaxID=2975053 RepID=A0ABT4CF14_9ACTN|nr:hypothetical protein [Nocardioides pini]MCY4726699.1 hypothetical protein [Nocardioides pini]
MPVVFGDAVAVIARRLRIDLAARDEPYADGVTVGTRTPDDREPHNGPTPLVVVTQDGPGTIQQRANSRATIRLSVWHHTEDDAYDLASLALGLAAEYRGPIVRHARPSLSPARTVDPDTGEPMAWATVLVNVAPRHI